MFETAFEQTCTISSPAPANLEIYGVDVAWIRLADARECLEEVCMTLNLYHYHYSVFGIPIC